MVSMDYLYIEKGDDVIIVETAAGYVWRIIDEIG